MQKHPIAVKGIDGREKKKEREYKAKNISSLPLTTFVVCEESEDWLSSSSSETKKVVALTNKSSTIQKIMEHIILELPIIKKMNKWKDSGFMR